jgi:translation initiation factor IF-2
MADINVKQLSKAIKIDLDNLLAQMKSAGLSHQSETDIVSTEDKKVLLKFIKDSKKDSKKTISLSTSSQKIAKPNLSVTRINSPDNEKKSNVKQDFAGSIDFDEAERKRLNAQNESAEEEKKKAEAKTKVVRKTKQESQKKIPQNPKKDKKTFKDSSKEDQREQEGEKFLAKNLENVQKFEKPQEFIQREVRIPETIVVSDLAKELSIKSSDLIKSLMNSGVMVTLNQAIDQETAILVVEELGHIGIPQEIESEEEKILEHIVYEGDEELRNPVVSVLGHVDHGKTSILDFIRKSSVADQEEGGITQGIGAYQVDHNNQTITFIDTPGHAAFSEMRARGANSTDIVVLVVAADDGIKPQTVEAIKHAKAAKVPIIVAINKCDLPEKNISKIKNEMMQYELIAEDLSGDTLFVEVSAIKKINLDKLKENILLQSEILDLKASYSDKARGVVIESKIDKGKGPVSTILISNGKLKRGDYFICGDTWGKIRAMINYEGKMVNEAFPSMPIEILGMNSSAYAGAEFMVTKDENEAKELTEFRKNNNNQNKVLAKDKTTLFEEVKDKDELNIIIKSDVQGSSEALKMAINKIEHKEVEAKIILSDIGMINETDVSLAKASNAILIGFNVKPNREAKKLAEEQKIDIKYFNIIYEAIDHVEKSLSGLLEPDIKETILGSAEIQKVFKVSTAGKIAGSKVISGEIKSKSKARIIRDGVVVYSGEILTIFREKNQVKEVGSGLECGISIKDFIDFKEKDVIESYLSEEVQRSI